MLRCWSTDDELFASCAEGAVAELLLLDVVKTTGGSTNDWHNIVGLPRLKHTVGKRTFEISTLAAAEALQAFPWPMRRLLEPKDGGWSVVVDHSMPFGYPAVAEKKLRTYRIGLSPNGVRFAAELATPLAAAAAKPALRLAAESMERLREKLATLTRRAPWGAGLAAEVLDFYAAAESGGADEPEEGGGSPEATLLAYATTVSRDERVMVYLDSVLNVPVRTAVARAAVARRPSWSASSSGRADSSTSCRTRTRRSCDVSSVHGPAGHRPRARPQPTMAPLRPTTSSSTRTRHKMRTGRRRAAATVPPPPVAECVSLGLRTGRACQSQTASGLSNSSSGAH